MSGFRLSAAVVFAGGLLFAPTGTLFASEPERLPQKAYEVRIEGGATPYVDMTFALAMSEVTNYPLTITAVKGSVEEVLYDGMLSEGVYHFRAPLKKITSGTVKVVLRTRITNRTAQGPLNSIRYLTWEGTIGP